MEKPSDFRKVPTEGNRKASTTRYGGFGVPASENVDSEVYETSVNHAEQRKRSAVFTFSTQIFLRKAEEEMLHSGLLALSVENGEMTLYESKHMERLLIADLSRMLSLTIKGEARCPALLQVSQGETEIALHFSGESRRLEFCQRKTVFMFS